MCRDLVRWVWCFAAALVWLALFPAAASAQDIAPLAERLRSGDDFRVRTQAALALGASGKAEAVDPLCHGLDDENTTVRAAAAAAIGRLALGGQECLNKRLERESSEEVKSVIQRALTRLQPKATITQDTLYYVSIGEVTNKTQRETAVLTRRVREILAQQIGQLQGFALAPDGETEEQAKAVLKKFPKAKGIFLWPKVQAQAQGRDLRLDFELSLFSYPNKDFRGSMARNLTMPDTSPGDAGTEDELISAAAENLVPELVKTAPRI
jgi:HEAT repeats